MDGLLVEVSDDSVTTRAVGSQRRNLGQNRPLVLRNLLSSQGRKNEKTGF